MSVRGLCLCDIGWRKRHGLRRALVKQSMCILDEVLHYWDLRKSAGNFTTGRCNVPSRESRFLSQDSPEGQPSRAR